MSSHPIKALILGKNTVAVECTKSLMKSSAAIPAVVIGGKEWDGNLRELCKKEGLKTLEFKKINSPEALKAIRELNPNIIFSFQFDQILRKELIEIPPMGCINLHFSLLPRYRGCAPIAHAMLNKEKEAGVSLHYIDEGIDSGDLISQKKVSIKEDDSARQLYDNLVKAGIELFAETLSSILDGSNPRLPQDKSKALYYPDGALDFKKTAKLDLKGLDPVTVQSMIFPPFQFPFFEFKGFKFFISKMEKIKEESEEK